MKKLSLNNFPKGKQLKNGRARMRAPVSNTSVLTLSFCFYFDRFIKVMRLYEVIRYRKVNNTLCFLRAHGVRERQRSCEQGPNAL